MSAGTVFFIATFTAPEEIGTNPQSMLWLLPLAAAIAVVYKAMKLPTITAGNFIKETAALFGSIAVFIITTALVLCVLAWLITE
jgi:ABC-type Co2+ transport system permease subunit